MYTVNMTLNIGEPLTDRRSDDTQVAPAHDERRRLADELLEELTGWGPADRAGMFRSWHRGALSMVHVSVIALLEAEGPLPMSRLADALDVSDASATGIVSRMEQRRLVERRHDADDRRVVLVHVTDEGADVFRQFAARRRERLDRLLTELTEEELSGFLLGLRSMKAALARMHDALESERSREIVHWRDQG